MEKEDGKQAPGSPEILNIHRAKIQDNNGGARIDIPKEISEALAIEPGQDIAEIRINKGKYGKYVEFWVPKKQEPGREK